jgi:primase-polymerase (primpol)-like protein
MIEPIFENIPERLQERRQWVLWRAIQRQGKQVKIPWSVYDQAASSVDPETWHEFETVVIQYRPGYHAGLGFVFVDGDGFAGIDLDSCRNPETGEIAGWAKQWLDKADGYAEVSPSQTGLKIWIHSDQKLDKGRNIKLDEEPLVPGKKPGIEIYTHGRYFAVTGQRVKDWQ